MLRDEEQADVADKIYMTVTRGRGYGFSRDDPEAQEHRSNNEILGALGAQYSLAEMDYNDGVYGFSAVGPDRPVSDATLVLTTAVLVLGGEGVYRYPRHAIQDVKALVRAGGGWNEAVRIAQERKNRMVNISF